MSGSLSEFERVLLGSLIPNWVSAEDRQMTASSYRGAKTPLSEHDAAAFLRAWEAGLLAHYERGRYEIVGTASVEQFFSSGKANSAPRPYTLWLEPIIAVGSIARLHFDFGWPLSLLGTQSKGGAFDVIAFRSQRDREHIAGEVKKTRSETLKLIELLHHFGDNPREEAPASGPRRNAFKKALALRCSQPEVFWAIGPDGLSEVFEVKYSDDGSFALSAASERRLSF